MAKVNDTIAVIGAGLGALPILRKAKEINIETIAFGGADSLAKDVADIFVVADIFDYEFIISECIKHNIKGIIASSEITTEVAAIIADKLNLPGNDISNGFAARSKFIMRERVSTLDTIRQPKYSLYKEGDTYKFPVVVKSLDSCGKKGISIAYCMDDLLSAVEESKKYSTNGLVLIEEYLKGGQEYSIECLAGNGNYDIIQYTEKESSGPPTFTEIAHHQPANLPIDTKKRIDVAVKDILKILGINCGMAHLELKIIDDELYFIEVGARGGGGHIADTLTVNSTDFDYFAEAINCCLGKYSHKEVHNVAYTGLYYHCKQNEHLKPLFNKAKTANWCICNAVTNDNFPEAYSNIEAYNSGYIIYCSDRKIDLTNY